MLEQKGQEITDERVEIINRQIKAIIALKERKKDDIPDMIFENLYIGGIGAAMNKKKLLDLGIKNVLSLTTMLKV